jgi:hypothetical protein
MYKYMLEKTERQIKNGQSRDTDSIRYTTHKTKTNKTIITTQKIKKVSNTQPIKNHNTEN